MATHPAPAVVAVKEPVAPTVSRRSVVATMIAAFAPAAGTAGGAADRHQGNHGDLSADIAPRPRYEDGCNEASEASEIEERKQEAEACVEDLRDLVNKVEMHPPRTIAGRPPRSADFSQRSAFATAPGECSRSGGMRRAQSSAL
jgi:hypothetical protein